MAWPTIPQFPDFNERKATQIAVAFLNMRGGAMSYLKLLKLMYLADRQALLKWGDLMTFDRMVSMDNGPVLSQTFGLIQEGVRPDRRAGRYWHQHISPPKNYEVSVIMGISEEDSDLSRAEEKILQDIFSSFGSMSRWEIVDYVHTLPEWKNPMNSVLPIEIEEILIGAGKSADEIQTALDGIAHMGWVEKTLA